MTEPGGKQKVTQKSFQWWEEAVPWLVHWTALHPLNEVELVDHEGGVTFQITDISAGDGRDLT